MAVSEGKRYSLGEFELESDKRLLTRNGEPVSLARRPFQVLVYLIENRDRLVTRKELLDLFWEGRDVYDMTLSRCVSSIRKALDDQSDQARFIETRWAEGYRFVGLVKETALIPQTSIFAIERTRGVRIVVEDDGEEGNSLNTRTVSPNMNPGAPSIKLLSASRTRRTTWLIRSLLICLMIALMVGAILLYRSRNKATVNEAPAIHSLAVLPLENMSGDAGQDYLADGTTEILITELAKIGGLRVISRTSVMQYKGTKKSLPDIARELHVDGIIEGAVIRSGGRVRVTAQLINAATDQHVWAESYDRDLSDMLSLQSEVAREIAKQINVTLTRQEETLLANKAPVNPAASEAYLKALYYLRETRNESQPEQKRQLILKSIEYYQEAIKAHPDYAVAYAGMAGAYNALASNEGVSEFRVKAKEAATKALQLDDSLSDAHLALANSIFTREWDWAGAEEQYERAIELNPSNQLAHALYSVYLSASGHHMEAVNQVNQAEILDPLVIQVKAGAAQIYNQAQQYDKAIDKLRIVLELRPDDPQSHGLLGLVYSRKGMFSEALAEFQKSSELSHGSPFPEAGIALVYAETGQRIDALKKLRKVIANEKDPTLSMVIAAVHAVLGDKEEAFRWLDKAYQARAQNLLTIRSYPEFENLRSDPRYIELLQRIRFPQSA